VGFVSIIATFVGIRAGLWRLTGRNHALAYETRLPASSAPALQRDADKQ
jgi:hypothetical protein